MKFFKKFSIEMVSVPVHSILGHIKYLMAFKVIHMLFNPNMSMSHSPTMMVLTRDTEQSTSISKHTSEWDVIIGQSIHRAWPDENAENLFELENLQKLQT